MNVIAPGLIETPMSRRAQGDPVLMAHVARMQPLSPAGQPSSVPLGRPEDVAAAVSYLAGPASYTSGINLMVDGGWMAY